MSFDPSQATSRLLSRGDKDGDNALSFSEFVGLDDKALSSGSATSSVSSERMTALFEAIDSDSDGKLSESELTDFGQQLSDAMSTFMLQMQEQAQFGNQGGADAGAGASSESTSYDLLDTNKDGVVSVMERVAGTQNAEQMPPERRRPPNGSEGGMDMLKSMLAATSYQLAGVTELSSVSSATITLV
jgi:Ca2+-binding EF-hand superfamily protein